MKQHPHDNEDRIGLAAEADGRQCQLHGAVRQLLFAAFGLRLLMDPWLGERQPFTPSFAAIAIAAWFAGWRAGLAAAILSYGLANYFLISPRQHLSFSSSEVVGAGSFFLITAVVLFLSHRATSANRALSELVNVLRGGEEDQRRSRGAGFDLHLTKPVSIEALDDALQVCAQRAAERLSA